MLFQTHKYFTTENYISLFSQLYLVMNHVLFKVLDKKCYKKQFKTKSILKPVSSVLSDEKEEESEDTGVKPEADMDEDDDDCDVPIIVVEEECPAIKQSHSIPPDFTEGNDAIKQELVATSAKKHGLQKSRMKALGAMQADENLLSQEMFISIHGNQFKLNGKGSFGTFLY